MAFVKNLNGKAVVCEYEDGAQLVPEVGYIAAIAQEDVVLFYGATDDDGIIAIGSTANGSPVETLVEAKAAIAALGTLFLDGVAI
jgi:hypothetical protein